MGFIESHALFTRTGSAGIRQVEVTGLVATAFTHRDSRAGDPDLHTHVAVANKVQTLPDTNNPGSQGGQGGAGRWLSIDGRVLFKATVAASETYNTALERHLSAALGVRFAERPDTDPRKRAVREIVGIDPELANRFSTRATDIGARRGELASAFQDANGRPPTPVESLKLAQQATLETRDAKHEPRSLAEQRTTWRTQALAVLGSPGRLAQMLHSALTPSAAAWGPATTDPGFADWFTHATSRIVSAMETRRSTWQVWHVTAEAQRQVRAANIPDLSPTRAAELADLLAAEVLTARSVSLARPDHLTGTQMEPGPLRRRDGASVYTVAGSELFTSTRVLAAEANLVSIAGRTDGRRVSDAAVEVALLEQHANGVTLNAGQVDLVRRMATSGCRLQLAIAPAGSGKTTALRALATAWTQQTLSPVPGLSVSGGNATGNAAHAGGNADGNALVGGGNAGGNPGRDVASGAGTVIGLAPSAAAAAVLAEQTGTRTDTLAKLTWSLQHHDPNARDGDLGGLPDWVAGIGPDTLVLIDEAGMADTLSLNTTVQFVTERGGSVRLIGDDQQLAAIGAGGVLRDIATTHGALHLSELLRFADPAEGAATLALREGRPEALGFYLDNARVHVGDLAVITDAVFDAWATDRAQHVDSIMLAPTRELVAELNQRARTHRITTLTDTGTNPHAEPEPGRVLRLADGNHASVGDLVLTRANDRRLRATGTDWVKNGDRWRITAVHDTGDLSVRHTGHHHTVRLPAAYVSASVELGYATTTHGAQGVSVDTMHGLATGAESRQQLYTMLTRGRRANHLYLQVTGDGDPHSVIRPELVHPATATEVLEQILARDDSPTSATTLLAQQDDPAVGLGQATARYLDALYVAAETTQIQAHGSQYGHHLEAAVNTLVPDLTGQPAWPALRAHLMLLAAHGDNPIDHLATAAAVGQLHTAADKAAVLDWRLDETGMRNTRVGPLPWLPGIPPTLADDDQWGPYLTARHDLVTNLTDQVHQQTLAGATAGDRPSWARSSASSRLSADPGLVTEVAVWRAATGVAATDRRPTGAPQLPKAAATWQRRLDRRVRQLVGDHAPAMAEWGPLLHALVPATVRDDFTPELAGRLAAISRAGLDAPALLRTAINQRSPGPDTRADKGTGTGTGGGSLPDDHAAAALWWRLSRHLSPAVATQIHTDHTPTTDWQTHLPKLVGATLAERLPASVSWPALVAVVDHGLARGWPLDDLLNAPNTTGRTDAATAQTTADELCEAMVWRASLLMQPIGSDPNGDDVPPPPDPARPYDEAPEDLWEGLNPAAAPPTEVDGQLDTDLEAGLARAAMLRGLRTPLEPTDAQINLMLQRANAWDHSPVTRERMVEINQLAQAYFEHHFTTSWGRGYLADRLGHDLCNDPGFGSDFRLGQAPTGWTGLVEHLRSRGITDPEMLATGVATTTRTGKIIDRFRDRLMFPITTPTHTGGHNGGHHDETLEIVGFIGRRHPDLTDTPTTGTRARAGWGPKYLNTAETPLFHKGAQLFGVLPQQLATGGIPVLVEGPVDAIAITLATAGAYVGLAPLGTALTDEQAAQLADIAALAGHEPVVATDADLAGRLAAERDYWQLTPHGLDPYLAHLPHGSDPAEILTQHGPAALAAVLHTTATTPLGQVLRAERLAHLRPDQARAEAATILAAQPPERWDSGVDQISRHLDLTQRQVRRDLHTAVEAWDADPRNVAQHQLGNLTVVRNRLTTSEAEPAQDPATQRVRVDEVAAPDLAPERRWAPLAARLDDRLLTQDDWPATAEIIQTAHDQGHDVATAARRYVADRPLGARPAQDLRYRLVIGLDLTLDQLPPVAADVREDRGVTAASTRRRPPAPATGTRRGRPHR